MLKVLQAVSMIIGLNLFSLLERLCYKLIGQRYSQGGQVSILPVYVALNRKPENGCEIQNVFFLKS
jgi:hypothetical protein